MSLNRNNILISIMHCNQYCKFRWASPGIARRVKAQKAQSAILENLNEAKYFDKIFTRKRVQRRNEMQLWEQTRTPVRHRCKFCGSIHLPRQSPAYGMMCAACGKISHFKMVCRSGRNKKLHNVYPHREQH